MDVCHTWTQQEGRGGLLLEALKEDLRNTQASSNSLGLVILSVQEDVPLPQLQHQCSGSVRPLQRLRGRGSGRPAPLEVPGRQVGPVW